MINMMPKQFIEQTLIKGVGCLMKEGNHFMAFAMMANSIEFLGKCLDPNKKEWDSPNVGNDFKKAIDELEAFKNYRSMNLYNNLRNGFAHFLAPKFPITLSNGRKSFHLAIDNSKTNINCEDFYDDFKNACYKIINMSFFDPNDKMNKSFLVIDINQNSSFPSGATSAIANI
jgi:hypothetical protein